MLKLTDKDLKRFWDKVNKTKDCWNWTASKTKQGYGRFKLNGKLESPHIISYQLHNQKETTNFDVCHKCDNPSCVNPDHLFLGSRGDNMRDCMAKGRFVVNNKKLTDKQVQEIKDKYIPRVYTAKMLAEEYNVAVITIKKIVN